MVKFNPMRWWIRFLALPNDSRGKTLAVVFSVAAVSSLTISMATHVLGPQIEANRAAARQAKLDRMVAELPELADILSGSEGDQLETLIVELDTGQLAGINPEGFDMAEMADNPETSTELDGNQDIAGIGRRPNYAQIYLLKDGRDVKLVVLPVYASGYQSTIRAYLALHGDLNTVAGLVITEQGETPGLGANIATPAWQALWPGKEIADEDGTLRLQVVRGKATSTFEVDGITGATRTGRGVSTMVAFWMGPDGYGPVLDALRTGAL